MLAEENIKNRGIFIEKNRTDNRIHSLPTSIIMS